MNEDEARELELDAEISAHDESLWIGEYCADEELEKLCDMVRERYPRTPDAAVIEEVPPTEIRQKICRVAVCPGYPGIVECFLIAGIRRGTEGTVVFCVKGEP